MGAVALLILKGAWGLLRRVPWPLWAFLALVLAFYLYGEHKDAAGESRGRAELQAKWDEAVIRGREEIARLDRENAAEDERARIKAEATGVQRERDHREALAEKDRNIAGLRSGAVRLRQQFQACLSRSEAEGAGPVPGGPVPDDTVRGTDALDMAGAVGGSIFIADDADSRVTRLVEYIGVLHAQCQ